MKREYFRWFSPRMQRDMELLVFGHSGAKVLAFPTRDGRFYEYENIGVVHSIAHKLTAGQLQLFCVDSVDHESHYCFWRHPADRIRRHQQFEEYVLNEVMPLMASLNSNPCTIAFGASLGAYHAMNIALRHPHLFQKLCAFSGRYDLTLSVEYFRDLYDGYYDENIYYNNPSHFLPNLICELRLNQIRAMDIVLTIGRDDPFLGNNRHFSQVLQEKAVNHRFYEWDGRAHRGSAWRKMTPLYL